MGVELRPYQEYGVRFLLERRAALLADDPGLGKTRTVAEALRRAGGRSLVVCPASLRDQWAREVDRWTGLRATVVEGDRAARAAAYRGAPADVVIVNYEKLLADADTLADAPFAAVVLDEAQRVKNLRTKTWAAAMRLAPAARRYVVTATPIENSLMDAHALLAWLGVEETAERGLNAGRGTWSSYFFMRQQPSARGRYAASVRGRTKEDVVEALRPVMLRRRKADVAPELPPRTDTVLRLPLAPAQERLYRAARDELVLLVGDERVPIHALIAQFTYLREICDSATLVDPTLAIAQDPAGMLRRACAASSKLGELVPRLESVARAGHRAVVFTDFARMARTIVAALDVAGIPAALLDGEATARRRAERELARFRAGDAPVLVATRTGEAGHNLQDADHLIEVEPLYNPARTLQRTERVHRLGQTRPVFVTTLVAAGTYEERVLEIAARKRELYRDVVDTLVDRRDYRAWLAALLEPPAAPPAVAPRPSGFAAELAALAREATP